MSSGQDVEAHERLIEGAIVAAQVVETTFDGMAEGAMVLDRHDRFVGLETLTAQPSDEGGLVEMAALRDGADMAGARLETSQLQPFEVRPRIDERPRRRGATPDRGLRIEHAEDGGYVAGAAQLHAQPAAGMQ